MEAANLVLTGCLLTAVSSPSCPPHSRPQGHHSQLAAVGAPVVEKVCFTGGRGDRQGLVCTSLTTGGH